LLRSFQESLLIRKSLPNSLGRRFCAGDYSHGVTLALEFDLEFNGVGEGDGEGSGVAVGEGVCANELSCK